MARWLPQLFGGHRAVELESKAASDRRASQGAFYTAKGMPYTSTWDIERAVRDGYEKVIWIFKGIDATAEKLSSWPIKAYQGSRDDPDRKVLTDADEPLLALLNNRANIVDGSAKYFRYRLISQLILSKKGVFVEVIPSKGGGIAALNLLPPGRTDPIPDPDKFLQGFQVTLGDGEVFGPWNTPGMKPYDPKTRRGVLWIRKPHPTDPYSGITPLEAAGISIDLDFYARLYNRNFLLNDGRAGQLVAVKGGLSDEDAQELKQRFSPGMGGVGRTTVIEADAISVQDTAVTPRDAQYAELRGITKEDLLIALGTPESVIGNASNRTFDNADAEKENWLEVTVQPLGGVVEAGFEPLTSGGFDDDRFLEHDTSNEPVLQRMKERAKDKARTDYDSGHITLDELRHILEVEEMSGPGTDVLWLNVVGKAPTGDDEGAVADAENLKPIAAPQPGAGMDPNSGFDPNDPSAAAPMDAADPNAPNLFGDGTDGGGGGGGGLDPTQPQSPSPADGSDASYDPYIQQAAAMSGYGYKTVLALEVKRDWWDHDEPFEVKAVNVPNVPGQFSWDENKVKRDANGRFAHVASKGLGHILDFPDGYPWAKVAGAPPATALPAPKKIKVGSLRKGDVIQETAKAGSPLWTVKSVTKGSHPDQLVIGLVNAKGEEKSQTAANKSIGAFVVARTPHPAMVAQAKKDKKAAVAAAPPGPKIMGKAASELKVGDVLVDHNGDQWEINEPPSKPDNSKDKLLIFGKPLGADTAAHGMANQLLGQFTADQKVTVKGAPAAAAPHPKMGTYEMPSGSTLVVGSSGHGIMLHSGSGGPGTNLEPAAVDTMLAANPDAKWTSAWPATDVNNAPIAAGHYQATGDQFGFTVYSDGSAQWDDEQPMSPSYLAVSVANAVAAHGGPTPMAGTYVSAQGAKITINPDGSADTIASPDMVAKHESTPTHNAVPSANLLNLIHDGLYTLDPKATPVAFPESDDGPFKTTPPGIYVAPDGTKMTVYPNGSATQHFTSGDVHLSAGDVAAMTTTGTMGWQKQPDDPASWGPSNPSPYAGAYLDTATGKILKVGGAGYGSYYNAAGKPDGGPSVTPATIASVTAAIMAGSGAQFDVDINAFDPPGPKVPNLSMLGFDGTDGEHHSITYNADDKVWVRDVGDHAPHGKPKIESVWVQHPDGTGEYYGLPNAWKGNHLSDSADIWDDLHNGSLNNVVGVHGVPTVTPKTPPAGVYNDAAGNKLFVYSNGNGAIHHPDGDVSDLAAAGVASEYAATKWTLAPESGGPPSPTISPRPYVGTWALDNMILTVTPDNVHLQSPGGETDHAIDSAVAQGFLSQLADPDHQGWVSGSESVPVGKWSVGNLHATVNPDGSVDTAHNHFAPASIFAKGAIAKIKAGEGTKVGAKPATGDQVWTKADDPTWTFALHPDGSATITFGSNAEKTELSPKAVPGNLKVMQDNADLYLPPQPADPVYYAGLWHPDGHVDDTALKVNDDGTGVWVYADGSESMKLSTGEVTAVLQAGGYSQHTGPQKGRYVHSGGQILTVNDDGSGLHVTAKGKVSTLTPAEVATTLAKPGWESATQPETQPLEPDDGTVFAVGAPSGLYGKLGVAGKLAIHPDGSWSLAKPQSDGTYKMGPHHTDFSGNKSEWTYEEPLPSAGGTWKAGDGSTFTMHADGSATVSASDGHVQYELEAGDGAQQAGGWLANVSTSPSWHKVEDGKTIAPPLPTGATKKATDLHAGDTITVGSSTVTVTSVHPTDSIVGSAVKVYGEPVDDSDWPATADQGDQDYLGGSLLATAHPDYEFATTASAAPLPDLNFPTSGDQVQKGSWVNTGDNVKMVVLPDGSADVYSYPGMDMPAASEPAPPGTQVVHIGPASVPSYAQDMHFGGDEGSELHKNTSPPSDMQPVNPLLDANEGDIFWQTWPGDVQLKLVKKGDGNVAVTTYGPAGPWSDKGHTATVSAFGLMAGAPIVKSPYPKPPDGADVYTHPQGKVIYVHPDGLIEVWGPDGKKKTSSATAENLAEGHGAWEQTQDFGGWTTVNNTEWFPDPSATPDYVPTPPAHAATVYTAVGENGPKMPGVYVPVQGDGNWTITVNANGEGWITSLKTGNATGPLTTEAMNGWLGSTSPGATYKSLDDVTGSSPAGGNATGNTPAELTASLTADQQSLLDLLEYPADYQWPQAPGLVPASVKPQNPTVKIGSLRNGDVVNLAGVHQSSDGVTLPLTVTKIKKQGTTGQVTVTGIVPDGGEVTFIVADASEVPVLARTPHPAQVAAAKKLKASLLGGGAGGQSPLLAPAAAPEGFTSAGGIVLSEKTKAAAKPKSIWSSHVINGGTILLPDGGSMIVTGKAYVPSTQKPDGTYRPGGYKLTGVPSADINPKYLTAADEATYYSGTHGSTVQWVPKAALNKKGALLAGPHATMTTPSPQPTAAPAAAVMTPGAGVPLSTSGWKKVGPQGGSNPGGVFQAPDGTKYYVKAPKTPVHAENEQLAAALYSAAGIKIPQVTKVPIAPELGLPSSVGIASKIVEGKKNLSSAHTDPAYRAKIVDGFAVDAWLANWDAAGTGMDNMIQLPDGSPLRVDVGGSLLYRAQGQPKGNAFGDHVGEVETLAGGPKNMMPDAGAVFGKVSKAELKASVEAHIAPISPAMIDALVEENMTSMTPAERDSLKATIKARRVDIAKQAGVVLPENKPFETVSVLGGKPLPYAPGKSISHDQVTLNGKDAWWHTETVGALSLTVGNVVYLNDDASAPYVITKFSEKVSGAPGPKGPVSDGGIGKVGAWGKKNGTGPEVFMFVQVESKGERQVRVQVDPPPGWTPPPPPPPPKPGEKLIIDPALWNKPGDPDAGSKLTHMYHALSLSKSMGNAWKLTTPEQRTQLAAVGITTQSEFAQYFGGIASSWNSSSNSGTPLLAFHHAVAIEFGLDDVAPWGTEEKNMKLKQEVAKHFAKWGAAYQAAARVIYANHVNEMHNAGISTVTLTRRLSFAPPDNAGGSTPAPPWAWSSGVHTDVTLRPMNSFAWDPNVWHGNTRITATVPVEATFSMGMTGPGGYSLSETEVVVLGVYGIPFKVETSGTKPHAGYTKEQYEKDFPEWKPGTSTLSGKKSWFDDAPGAYDDIDASGAGSPYPNSATEDWLKGSYWPFVDSDGDDVIGLHELMDLYPDVVPWSLLDLPVGQAMPPSLRDELLDAEVDDDDIGPFAAEYLPAELRRPPTAAAPLEAKEWVGL